MLRRSLFLLTLATLVAYHLGAEELPPQAPSATQVDRGPAAPKDVVTRYGLTAPASLFEAARPMTVGSPDAPVHLVVFSDYSCPYCATFAAASRLLEDRYVADGKLQKVHVDFPLARMQRSYLMALAGRCAEDQARFWPFYYLAMDRQPRWRDAPDLMVELRAYASQVRLDVEAFERCLRDDGKVPVVNAGRQLGEHVGVRWVPFVLVNGRLIEDAGNFGQVTAAIDAELARLGR